MTSTNYTLYLHQGAGNYEDGEESDSSQETEVSSQGTESSREEEETENLEPWSRILEEAENRHETQLNALINQYQENGDSENVARSKAVNALVLVDACNEKRSHLQKNDGKSKRAKERRSGKIEQNLNFLTKLSRVDFFHLLSIIRFY